MTRPQATHLSEGDQIRVSHPLKTGWTGRGTVIEQDGRYLVIVNEDEYSTLEKSRRIPIPEPVESQVIEGEVQDE